MQTIDQIRQIKQQIEAKQIELGQFQKSLSVLTNPPKYAPAPGQWSMLAQVQELLNSQKSEADRLAALQRQYGEAFQKLGLRLDAVNSAVRFTGTGDRPVDARIWTDGESQVIFEDEEDDW